MHDEKLALLIESLQNPGLYDHTVAAFTVLQTHISYVLLTGPFAYKFKKPVDLGFLDFTTLELRKFYCEEELRLNRRLAPELYVDVIAITGSETAPRLNGPGPVIEFAVKMVQFPQEEQLDRVLSRGDLVARHIDQLAGDIAGFHAQVAVADTSSPFGDLAHVRQPVQQNFNQVRSCAATTPAADQCKRLQDWSRQTLDSHTIIFQERKQQGAIRECHGDMHLANMALHRGRVVIFDCIEFNENLRWIDMISEAAFLMMDLDHRGRPKFARRFLNRYLERRGDYYGLNVLPHYLVYRAMVRAKVACILLRENEVDSAQRVRAREDFRRHLDLAEDYTRSRPTPLIITHGLSGSGKTMITEQLVESLGAVRVRSDIERKRLLGLPWDARTDSAVAGGAYAAKTTQRTYARLLELARETLKAGFPVIIDATFLNHSRRAAFHSLADRSRSPFVILDFQASENVLRERIARRLAQEKDASEAGLAVLEYQLRHREPLTAEAQHNIIHIDAERPVEIDTITKQIRALH